MPTYATISFEQNLLSVLESVITRVAKGTLDEGRRGAQVVIVQPSIYQKCRAGAERVRVLDFLETTFSSRGRRGGPWKVRKQKRDCEIFSSCYFTAAAAYPVLVLSWLRWWRCGAPCACAFEHRHSHVVRNGCGFCQAVTATLRAVDA